VEEKDVQVEPEEDVEAHVETGETIGETINREDEGDDVEAHKVKHENLARADEGDEEDVEAHQQLNAVEMGEQLDENMG
jgi:hypothetical protein